MRTTALWALLLLAGCGGKYGRTVPDDMVSKLTYEDKVDLVEAENDLFVAYDRVDDAENEILRTRDQIRRAKKSESLAGAPRPRPAHRDLVAGEAELDVLVGQVEDFLQAALDLGRTAGERHPHDRCSNGDGEPLHRQVLHSGSTSAPASVPFFTLASSFFAPSWSP